MLPYKYINIYIYIHLYIHISYIYIKKGFPLKIPEYRIGNVEGAVATQGGILGGGECPPRFLGESTGRRPPELRVCVWGGGVTPPRQPEFDNRFSTLLVRRAGHTYIYIYIYIYNNSFSTLLVRRAGHVCIYKYMF